jgi:hypothetical protein
VKSKKYEEFVLSVSASTPIKNCFKELHPE